MKTQRCGSHFLLEHEIAQGARWAVDAKLQKALDEMWLNLRGKAHVERPKFTLKDFSFNHHPPVLHVAVLANRENELAGQLTPSSMHQPTSLLLVSIECLGVQCSPEWISRQ